MIHARDTTAQGSPRGIGLSLPTIVLLAAIAAICVPLHDLGMIREGGAAAALLVFVPLAAWVGVVLRRRAPNPLLTLTIVGLAYGVMLAVIHQLLWGAAFGGDLEGELDPGAEAAVFRVSAFFDSLMTGTMVGAAAGAVAWAIARLRRT